ncbi:nickel-dependent hydrogenase large subunit [Thermodesulfitimonas autotrophica]|uniref:nickel-dependent hydrogenase large subunit n=1 Tax=Thermodesulfitimonas autotrophica TaxID=1894989 RepID=UPI002FDF12A8
MRKQIVIDPITRANNCGHVEITVAKGRVADCRVGALFFRGFELLLRGRDPRDAPYLAQRICGICAAAHATAAAYALENLAGVVPPQNGHLIRNLILAAETLQNHIRHFYLLALPDYVRGPAKPPFTPRYRYDYRLPPEVEARLMAHYSEAVGIARIAHEIVAALGGKAPHQHGILAGGTSFPPDGALILDLKAKLDRLGRFIAAKMLPDAEMLAAAYKDYFERGQRPLRLLTFGMYPVNPERTRFHFPGGLIEDDNGAQAVDVNAVAEHLRHAYFEAAAAPEAPGRATTRPQPDKPGAYSWIKAPRYAGKAFEGGPLARLWVTGRYRRGISVLDRLLARVQETEMLCQLMAQWIEALEPGRPVFTPYEIPRAGEGLGLTDAMRGPLLHYLRVEGGRLSRYEIITPSAWNFSPRDDKGEPGPVEEALIGTPVADPAEPVEIGRIIRSFDPCYACATHLIRKDEG